MKPPKLLYLSILALSSLLFSCKKDSTHTSTSVAPPVTGTMNINLSYNPGSAFELIISETGGKILLDTLTPASGNNIIATLKTNQTLVDYTLVNYDSGASAYYASTYKGVNPSSWTWLTAGDYFAPEGPLPSRSASILYTNTPVGNIYPYIFNDYVGTFSSSPTNTSAGDLAFNYSQNGSNNYLYLLFPALGMYNFHIPKGLNDTVDLTSMDTAVMLNFNKPAEYTMQSCTLIGVMDTTDFSRNVVLYGFLHYPGTPDMEYPRKLVQKLELSANAASSNNDYASYYSYGDSIPSTLPLADESSYTITSTQNTNFSLKFLSAAPSYYTTGWKTQGITWALSASPDSTTLNPLSLLTALKSKMLQGIDLSGLSLSSFGFEAAQGLDYAGFLSYVCNPNLIKTQRLSSSIQFSKSF